ncbi:MAG: GNAT family N-acetyltransferase [candidate division WOR-3 bacterium]
MKSAYLLTLNGEEEMRKLVILPKNFNKKEDIYTYYFNLDILRIIEEGGIVKVLYEDKKDEIIGLVCAEFYDNYLIIPYLLAPNLPLKSKLLSQILKETSDKRIILKIPSNEEKFIQYLMGNNFKLINTFILFLGKEDILKIEKPSVNYEELKTSVETINSTIFFYLLLQKNCIGILNAQKLGMSFPIVRISSIYIEEKYRNQKLGNFLLFSFLSFLFKEKKYFVVTEVPLGNLPAIRLFSSFNFGIIGSYKVLIR